MDAAEAVKQELARISALLSRSLQSCTPEEWREIVEKTIGKIDDVIEGLGKTSVVPPRVEAVVLSSGPELDGSLPWCSPAQWFGAPDIAFMPINGAVTEFPRLSPASGIAADLMPDQAAAAAAILGARFVCPIHYKTFDNPPIYSEWPEAERIFLEEARRRRVHAQVIDPGKGVPSPLG